MNTPNTKTGAFAPPPVYPMPSYLIEQAIAGVGALNISEEKQQALIDAITEAAMGLTLRDRFAIEAMPFFFNSYKQHLSFLNTEENRLLAELRDAMLPHLMSGDLEISNKEE